jgi:hypothetical protein
VFLGYAGQGNRVFPARVVASRVTVDSSFDETTQKSTTMTTIDISLYTPAD